MHTKDKAGYMNNISSIASIPWNCHHTWKKASYNTMWCLIGCSIGDMGTIAYFQYSDSGLPVLAIMILAVINGLITSIILETIILCKQMAFAEAFKTACGMSLISMISMEIAMNALDVALTGGAKLTLWVIPLMWLVGFLTPLPYNYWRLKALGKSCH
ncbi:MAG: hypothetical protein CFH06_01876 [Alphaproteobacteria bacterium MarineAlpha3_Bin5]|nr:MAG: hypothetical protein CFH06_01876 [Alphaproteobacteria bacterium MarineAlpha3_Bin5]|tara:strand:+ start:1429 stop:1902 length:474 start_codon:yes stop_codon:yes gene_type:complete